MNSPQSVVNISLSVNGAHVCAQVCEETSLLHFLRNDCALNSPKYGCGFGECGACSVLIDGVPARACVIPARHMVGREIVTLEGLAVNGQPGIVQQAFIDAQAAQCGYCLSGMIINACFILGKREELSDIEIKQKMSSCLCRCGTHDEILQAVKLAHRRLQAIAGADAASTNPLTSPQSAHTA